MGKFNKHLRCHKNSTIDECPICASQPIAQDLQPQSGTHVFTKVYECGTEIDFPIGYNGAEYGVSCNGEVKRRDFDKESIEKYLKNKDK